jgi:hypothetical protein
MKTFFEYFYYRIAKLNFGNNNPERAMIGLTSCQTIILLNVIMSVYLLIFPDIKRKFHVYEIIIILIIFFAIDYYNSKLYKGRYEEFHKRWGNESKKKKVINFIWVILFILFSWGLIFINSWIFGRFKTY